MVSAEEITVKQITAYFEENGLRCISYWEIILIDQTNSVEHLRRKESPRQYELGIFQSNRLKELDAALF